MSLTNLILKMKHKENETYELIPGEGDNDQCWHIRILEGDFVETVIQFGNVTIHGGEDDEDGHMKFNFHIVTSPDSELTEESEELQETAGEILLALIEENLYNNTSEMMIKEPHEEEWKRA